MSSEGLDQGGRDGEAIASARERILFQRVAELEAEMETIRADFDALRRRQDSDALRMRSHEARMDRLRLDRQIRALPTWLGNRARSANPTSHATPRAKSPNNLLVLAPKYPSRRTPYGGQPVERRLNFYTKAGLSALVLVASNGPRKTETRDGVEVVRTSLNDLRTIIERTGRSQIIVHHPTPEVWAAVRPMVGEMPIHLWIHGFEARDWRDADFESSSQEMANKAVRLDPVNEDRRRALSEAFADERVTKIFVSEFVRTVATDFVGVDPLNWRVIHNVIDTNIFDYVRREPGSSMRILTVKSFAARTYATDLVRDTIEELAGRSVFGQLEFEIRGDGKYFDEDTEPLARFGNVRLSRGFASASEMASLMHRHGVLLSPTRLDTQGITMGEAMATGMVVATNRVAAIPEFVDEDSGILVEPEDAVGLADAVEALCNSNERFAELSENAARRVRAQCAPAVTVQKEIELIRESASKQSG